ncbi:MAG: hypothetical protein CFE25_04665 [Chitinophagaceae bacterium BSSC1]|nr:MAG: hypothetical protein CFE25_04665 [Chitinophagaceae bacterium BSSC1]
MKISFKKRTGSKNIISYLRPSLPDRWIEADCFLILHDLSHYAIETKLAYQSAFWGLIKSGIHPSVFENKEARDKMLISNEAWYAECLANLFVIEITQGAFEDFNEVFHQSLKQMNKNIPDLHLITNEINEIRDYYKELVNAWKMLEPNKEMVLHF